jgi:hypothetical protein
MKAEVPYLARLARQAAGQAMLSPPHQLFTGGIDTPVRMPDRGGPLRRHATGAATSLPGPLTPAATGGERIAPEAITPAHGADTGGERGAGLKPGSAAFVGPASAPEAAVTPATSTAPRATVTPAPAPEAAATPATSARQEPAAGIPVPPGSPEMPWPPQVGPRERSASYSGPPAAGPANSASARPVALPKEPSASSSSRPAADTGPVPQPGSWASPLWGGPVDLPEAIDPVPVADGAARQAVSVSPAGPATPPSGPGTAASRHGQRTDDAGTSVARGAVGPRAPGAEGAADPNRSREPAPVRDLMPPPSSRTRPAAMSGTEPAEPYREPPVPRRPHVSIGTIEVTVVPPAPPAPAVREAQPPPPVTHGWSRPPSLLASSVGSDRLRDGLRRWYGTAQG